MKSARISVRSLVEFILRSGDIDNRKEISGDPDAMQEGIRIHKKIQKQMPSGYRAEVGLKEEFTDKDLLLTVEGRADGIWKKDDTVIIDEIKSMYANLTYMEYPRSIHLAQAKAYAAMYSKENGLEKIDVQITYCDIDTEEIKRFKYTFKTSDLRSWFESVVCEYFKWAHMLSDHTEARNASIADLDFPFEYRPGQKEVARDVYRAIKRNRNLFIEAPTGVGKTLSVLFPSLKAMGEALSDKIFYLTAKTVTATVANDTLKLLSEKGLDIKSVHITAKEKSCANGEFICNPDACPYADGHFDRVNAAVFDILTNENVITRDVILSYALKHKVCPYEYSLDISNACDVIIGDYNYAFDPRVKLKRYFESSFAGECIFLIDEAHNLVSRACEMFSSVIVKEDILECARLTKGMSKRLTSALTGANKRMLELKRECDEDYKVIESCDDLYSSLNMVFSELSKFLEKHRFFDYREDVLDFFFKVKTFCDVYSQIDSGYRIYTGFQHDGSFALKLLCIDPSVNLSECLLSARSAVFFSATLLPVQYYKELLTGNSEEYAIYAETSFSQDQRLLAIGTDVSSRYTSRGPEMYKRIADYVKAAVLSRSGNYMVFFPSYEFLDRVSEYLEKDNSSYDCLIQSPNLSEKEREDFLSEFSRERAGSLIGLCVAGGIFSEGIDLTDEKLIGAVIVGTGLPMINPESEIAKDYFNGLGKDGFAYAYRYPGMNKVMQAAGRVIRKETDTGVILLLDERFTHPDYRSLFPREWDDYVTTGLNKLPGLLENFWGKTKLRLS